MGAGHSGAELAALPDWQQTVHVPYYGCSATRTNAEGSCVPEAYAHQLGVEALSDPRAAFEAACEADISARMRDVVDSWDAASCADYVARQASLDYGTQKHTFVHASGPPPDATELLDALTMAAYDARQAEEPPVETVEANLWDPWPGVNATLLAMQRGYLLTLLGGALPARAPVYYEVGFDVGHSAALVLGSFPGASATSFDTCGAPGHDDAAEAIRDAYGADAFDLVCGESAQTLPAHAGPKFHAAFVDGSRLYLHVRDDLLNLQKFAAPDALIVVNKCDHNHVQLAWNHSRASGLFTELPRHLAPDTGFCLGKYDADWAPQPDTYQEDWYKNPQAATPQSLNEVEPDL